MVVKTKTVILYDGTKKRLFARANTEQEALKKLSDMEAGQRAVHEKMSLNAWAMEWLETYLKPSVKSNVFSSYETILRLHVLPKLGDVPLSALRPIQLQKCVNDMEDSSASQINKARIVLTGLFRDAKLNHLVVEDPIAGVKWPHGYSGERRALTPEERRIFMEVITGHHRGAMFGLMYGCGLRPGEVRALRWSDIKGNDIFVQHAIKKEGEELGATKSKSGVRTVPMPPWLRELVNKLPKTSVFVFPNSNGSYISAVRQRDSWNSLKNMMLLRAGVPTYRNQVVPEEAEKCSINELTMYYLRHTYATILIENGVDIRTVQYLMGHANIGVTSKIYAHVTNAVVTAARDKIDGIDFTGEPKVTSARPISFLPSVKAK